MEAVFNDFAHERRPGQGELPRPEDRFRGQLFDAERARGRTPEARWHLVTPATLSNAIRAIRGVLARFFGS